MRWIFGLLVCTCAAAASAALANPVSSLDPLTDAAFAGPTLGGATAPGPRYIAGQGMVQVAGGQTASFAPEGAPYVDTVTVYTAGRDANPAAALLRPHSRDGGEIRAYDVSYVRNWPAALRLNAGKVSLDVTPHAGIGMMSGGQTAEAGAMLRFGNRPEQRLLAGLDPREAAQSRIFLYAGARRKAGGLGLLRSATAPLGDNFARDGLVKETQAGFAFRRGAMQASFGYTREKVVMRAMGEDVRTDNRVGFTFSIR
jgi:hypothetical protein